MELGCSSRLAGRLTVDLDAVRANFSTIATHVAPGRSGAVVKADAYGLGVGSIVPALCRQGCRDFFVAHLAEAVSVANLVEADSTIFVLNGVGAGDEPLCADMGFIPVLNSLEQAERWCAMAASRNAPLPGALQIDTGMSRLGISPKEAAALAQDVNFASWVPLRILMTHLACSDQPRHESNARQRDCFARAANLYPGVCRSISNSGGVFLGEAFHYDVVRPGIALFGVAASDVSSSLRPVVRLDAPVIQLREIPRGTGVGYGLDYLAPAPRRVATLGVGYGDGWPRSLGGCGAAWFEETRLPIVGRISMDTMTIDVTALSEDVLQPGVFVELIGPHQSLEDVARDADTISYEILTRLGSRYQRIYVEDSAVGQPGVRAKP